MGKVIMSGIVPQLKEPISVEANFANNTWEQIIAACQANAVPDTWVVGDQKSMTINGADYVIDIIGKHHDIYADGSGTAPLTFQMRDCYSTPYRMNSSNLNSEGWNQCEMRRTHLPALLKLMPSEVQAGIKNVNKLTSAGVGSITINTTADALFLLSEIEVFGTCTYSYSGEGTQYDYYKAGNSKKKNIKDNTGVHSYAWRLRSPRANSNDSFCAVDGNGSQYTATSSTTLGVAFAFCF